MQKYDSKKKVKTQDDPSVILLKAEVDLLYTRNCAWRVNLFSTASHVSFLASQMIFFFLISFINFHLGFPSQLLPASPLIKQQHCVFANLVNCVRSRNQKCDNECNILESAVMLSR